jgi:agmatinase
MTKAEKIASFNPDAVGQQNGNLFGLPFSYEDCKIAILPVPWDVTVSYSAGTSGGPEAILDASPQLDFFDPDFNDAWKIGFHLTPVSRDWKKLSHELRQKAIDYISFLENGGDPSKDSAMMQILDELNNACDMLRARVKERCLELMNDGKMVALLGGDHSTPLGLIQALAEKHDSFGILQIDAHADLRDSYEGFKFSHASIMHNALKEKKVEKLVQVGIRDFCKEEAVLADKSNGRVKIFFDHALKGAAFEGKTWKQICEEIISELPQNVYISFDIDGLDPKLCPNTGTPVPGGFEFEQVVYLLRLIVKSGKQIIGFDLNEVTPGEDEWDANVGARLLWKLCVFFALSNKLEP